MERHTCSLAHVLRKPSRSTHVGKSFRTAFVEKYIFYWNDTPSCQQSYSYIEHLPLLFVLKGLTLFIQNLAPFVIWRITFFSQSKFPETRNPLSRLHSNSASSYGLGGWILKQTESINQSQTAKRRNNVKIPIEVVLREMLLNTTPVFTLFGQSIVF